MSEDDNLFVLWDAYVDNVSPKVETKYVNMEQVLDAILRRGYAFVTLRDSVEEETKT